MTERNYTKEYREYHGSEEQKKRRAQRNKARRLMERLGRVRKGDGKDVDHVRSSKDGNLDSRLSNLRVLSRSTNRSRNNNR